MGLSVTPGIVGAEARAAISLAKKTGAERGDWGLACYMLRDLKATSLAGLSDLAWACSNPDFGYTSRGDFNGLAESLEQWISQQEKAS